MVCLDLFADHRPELPRVVVALFRRLRPLLTRVNERGEPVVSIAASFHDVDDRADEDDGGDAGEGDGEGGHSAALISTGGASTRASRRRVIASSDSTGPCSPAVFRAHSKPSGFSRRT